MIQGDTIENVTPARRIRKDAIGTIAGMEDMEIDDLTEMMTMGTDVTTDVVIGTVPTEKATVIEVAPHPPSGIGLAGIDERTILAVRQKEPNEIKSAGTGRGRAIETDQGKGIETESIGADENGQSHAQNITEGNHIRSLAVAPRAAIEILSLAAIGVIANLP